MDETQSNFVDSGLNDSDIQRMEGMPGNIPKSGNILQKAANSINQVQTAMNPIMNAASPQQIGYSVGMGTVPQDVGGFLASKFLGQPSGIGGIAPQAEGNRETEVNKIQDPLAKFGVGVATDPMTYGGVGEAGAKTGEAVGNVFQNVVNPSKVYGQKLASMKGTVDFLPHIMSAIDDPVAGKLIEKAGVLEKFGGTTLGEGGMPAEKLSNLSPEDSQNVINSLKDEVTKAVKEGTLKPKQLEVGKLFSNLSQAQNDAFEGMSGAKFNYGLSKNVQKGAKGIAATALTGGGFEGGRRMAGDVIKHIFGL